MGKHNKRKRSRSISSERGSELNQILNKLRSIENRVQQNERSIKRFRRSVRRSDSRVSNRNT